MSSGTFGEGGQLAQEGTRVAVPGVTNHRVRPSVVPTLRKPWRVPQAKCKVPRFHHGHLTVEVDLEGSGEHLRLPSSWL